MEGKKIVREFPPQPIIIHVFVDVWIGGRDRRNLNRSYTLHVHAATQAVALNLWCLLCLFLKKPIYQFASDADLVR